MKVKLEMEYVEYYRLIQLAQDEETRLYNAKQDNQYSTAHRDALRREEAKHKLLRNRLDNALTEALKNEIPYRKREAEELWHGYPAQADEQREY